LSAHLCFEFTRLVQHHQLALDVDVGVVRRKLVTAVRYLSAEPDALEPLEAAGAIPRLVTMLGLTPEDIELKQSALTTLVGDDVPLSVSLLRLTALGKVELGRDGIWGGRRATRRCFATPADLLFGL
jgi:hypothetical protein